MAVRLPSDLIIRLDQLGGDGYACWGDTNRLNPDAQIAGPPQYRFIDTRERFIRQITDQNKSFPYLTVDPFVGIRFPRPIDRFAIYLQRQGWDLGDTSNPLNLNAPGIRIMIRCGLGDQQSRIWEGTFIQPAYQNPVNGSGNNNQELGRLIEICGPMADQWEVWMSSIAGAGGRLPVQQQLLCHYYGMVASTCSLGALPGPYVTQIFPAP
jgi:hypothetical protein